ncbi:putative NRPS-like enzyme [Xylariomycetidae sp. FL0641]|nr:putative NRPS-like enzyme [Xylariomycetidae sp. FL0641]
MATEHSHAAEWRHDLLPHMVDRLARKRPDATYGLWPKSPSSYSEGYRTINYAQLANVVNGLAWWLVNHLGPGQNREVLTYIGPNDIRFTSIVIAGMKAGYPLFFTSPRNSPVAHVALFNALQCSTLVTTHPIPPPALGVIESVHPKILTAPGVDELLDNVYPPFAYGQTFEEGKSDPFWIIHTSGSTGTPRPLIWTHDAASRHHELSAQTPPDGLISIDHLCHGKRVLVTLPPFHGAGLGQYMLNAIPFGTTGEGVVEALKQTPADVAILSPELLDYCSENLELILYIGGDLPQAVGDRVAAKVPLRCQWGASEVGIPHQLVPSLDADDWRYLRFHPSSGAAFDQVADGFFELVFRHDPALEATQPCFGIRGQEKLSEYRTRDLFERHPSKPDMWCWKARADDIIVFLNGEKTNPVSMEQHVVSQNPGLNGALVIGMQRFQAALLVEPASTIEFPSGSTAERASFIEKIWPSVEEANRAAPAHARVEKSLILVTTPDRPLIRAGKGTIQRAASLAQYSKEIEKLYNDANESLDDEESAGAPVNLADATAVATSIRSHIGKVLDMSSASIDDAQSLFEYGLDSLQALQLTRLLRRAFHRPSLALSTVYQNATIAQLTAILLDQQDDAESDRSIMEPLLSTYCGLIEQIPKPERNTSAPTHATDEGEPYDVILTGSRGTLGKSLVRALVAHPSVGHIFCLDRKRAGTKPAPDDDASAAIAPRERVTFLTVDLAHPSLALDDATLDTLRRRARLIIHNAWTVNFNLGLSAFRPQLAGLVNLLSLASAAVPSPMRLLFVSSVGAVSGRVPEEGGHDAAPEDVLKSFDSPYPNGYARSKFLAERLCDFAGTHTEVDVAVARVGQVAGPVRQEGLWSKAEWLPSLVASSLRLGCLPDSLGRLSVIDWVPSDLLGDAIVELLTRQADARGAETSSRGAEVFNLRNPATTTWDTLIPAIQRYSQDQLQRQLEVVPPSVWLSKLQSLEAATDQDTPASTPFPAVKLLDFYRHGLWEDGGTACPMSIDRALRCSPTLRSMEAINGESMSKWIKGWMSQGE